jgi:hypothetical protein
VVSCGACHDTHAERAVAPLELEYPVADSLVIEVQPPPPPSPLELLQALIPHLVSVALLIGLILYIGKAVLEIIEEMHGGQGA